MRQISFFSLVFVAALFSATTISCTKTETVSVDSALPQGTFTSLKKGNILEQNGIKTA